MYVLKTHDGRYSTRGVLKTTDIEQARQWTEEEMQRHLEYETGHRETFAAFEDEVRATIEALRDRAVTLARLLP
ncbi:MAG: hypothetical protein EOP83_04410 [Verrucomicrobiaceae bacterium]|nr:MAG: hypothetical protein EOP83_04410 [Verrucomicrobiaceae bacterium]